MSHWHLPKAYIPGGQHSICKSRRQCGRACASVIVWWKNAWVYLPCMQMASRMPLWQCIVLLRVWQLSLQLFSVGFTAVKHAKGNQRQFVNNLEVGGTPFCVVCVNQRHTATQQGCPMVYQHHLSLNCPTSVLHGFLVRLCIHSIHTRGNKFAQLSFWID